MTSLGEELLATKTIPELRQLVSSLAEDGTSKRRELQQMVGSKYQDFLQSADMVSGMRGRADLVESELHSFWTAKTELELLTREFLEQAMKGISGAGVITEHGLSDTASKMQQSNSENKADSSDSRFKRRRNFVDVSVAAVWDSLNECDVLSAAKVVLWATLLEGADRKSGLISLVPLQGVEDSKCVIRQERPSILTQAAATCFLSTTVADDAYILLFQPGHLTGRTEGVITDSAGKAQALAALVLLGDGVSTLNDSLRVYLESAELRLAQIYQRFHTGSVTNVGTGSDSVGGDVHYLSFSQLVLCFTGLVRTLQEIIMDLYLLFFATATTSSASPRSRNALTSQGMVSLYCMELINSLREAVLETCGSNNSMYSSVDDVQRIFFAGESVSGTWKSVLQPWLQQTLKIVTNRCKQALSGLVSAAEVSQLQQIVWRCATNTSIQSASQRIESCKEQSSYTQETWERASMFLLASLNKTSLPSMKVANERSISSSAILWGVAFRSSFTHQVERLLRRSCLAVAARARSNLRQMLQLEGLQIQETSNGLVVSLMASRQIKSSEQEDWKYTEEPLPSPIALSTKVFKAAEKFRVRFERDLTSLIEEVLQPVYNVADDAQDSPHDTDSHASDPQSMASLCKSLRTQCTQLIAQVIVYIRGAAEACRDALSADGFLPSTAISATKEGKLLDALAKSFGLSMEMDSSVIDDFDLDFQDSKASSATFKADADKSYNDALHSVIRETLTSTIRSKHRATWRQTAFDRNIIVEGEEALLSGLLLLGRVAWVLKVRGDFLTLALTQNFPTITLSSSSATPVSTRSKERSSNIEYDLNTEDQFRSAFEIADSDGDGILTVNEATEALQALDVADPSAKQADTSESFLSASFTPSLTYAEFSLMCGHLLTSAAARPQVHLLRAINTIFVFCHVYWARAVTFRYSCGLYSKMVEYLCLDDLTASTINSQSLVVKSGNFKLSWVNKGIDLDAAMEDIAIPARCSRDLVEYLTTLNTQVMHCFLSIDSVQKAYDVTVNNYNSSEVDEITDASFGDSSREVVDEACVKSTSLCFFVNKVFWHLAMSEIFVVYAELLVLARQPNMGSLKGEIIEEATLQAIFDLSVCDTIANFTLSMTDNSKSVPQINSTSVTCFKHLIEDWQMLMDPITAELVLPYLKMTSKQFMKSMQLLVAEIPVRMEVDEAQSIKQSKLDGIFASNAETTITKAHFALLPLSFSATGSTSMQQNLVDEFINSPTATDSSIDGTLPRKSASVSVTPSSSHGSFMSSFGFLRK